MKIKMNEEGKKRSKAPGFRRRMYLDEISTDQLQQNTKKTKQFLHDLEFID